MISICILGDLHGNYSKLDEILSITDADLYLQVGGYSVSYGETKEHLPVEKPLYFIPGNHERWNELEPLNQFSQDKVFELAKNLWYIPLGHYLTFKGIRIVGFGGNYAKSRYAWKRNQLQNERRRHYTESDFEKTVKLNRCDILLTHEPASPFPWRGSDAGSPIITSLVARLRPKYHFFGHMHVYREQMIGDCKSYCIPIHEFRIFEV